MNVMELWAKIGLDMTEYNKGLSKVSSDFNSLGNKFTKFGQGLQRSVENIVKVETFVVGAVAAGVASLIKQSIAGFAEQEQLLGGVETLYKSSAQNMIQYANDAYKSAGLSANEYMTTAIESSAAMINSLDGDTKKAAEMTNMAIIDMSDNVNKMGTTMESLQFAYRGFSRGNFTMLDNLALGFAGTKEGMQELLDKAEELSGIKYDISSYADIVQAIHVVQEEMGITGTTAKEAEGTISGSLNSLKSAWNNLIDGLANDKLDKDLLVNNVVDAAETAMDNVIPVLDRVLDSLGDVMDKIVPLAQEKLPELAEKIRPIAQKAFEVVGQAILSLLPENAKDNVISFVNIVINAIEKLVAAWNNLSDQQKDAVMEGLVNLALLAPAISGVGKAIETVGGILSGIGSIASAISAVLAGGAATVAAGIAGAALAVGAFIEMWQNGWSEISTILEAIGIAVAAVVAVVLGAEIAIAAAIAAVVFGVTQAIILIHDNWDKVTEGMRNTLDEFAQSCKALWDDMCEAFIMVGNGVSKWWNDLCDGLKKWWDELCSNVKKLWNDTTKELSNGIEIVKSNFSTAIDNIKNFFSGLWNKVEETANNIQNKFSDITQKISGFFSDIIGDAFNWGSDLIDNFIDGIEFMWDKLTTTVSNMADTIADYIGFSEPKKGPLSNFHTYAPDMVDLFAKGITDNIDTVESAINQLSKKIELDSEIAIKNTASQAQNQPTTTASSPDMSGGFVFNQTINAPQELDPSEIARQARNAMRATVLQLRMA